MNVHVGKRINLYSYFILGTKINFRWITNINIKDKTVSFEIKTGKYFYELGMGKDLKEITVLTIREKITALKLTSFIKTLLRE